MYDITSTDSFNRAKAWVRELQRQGSPNMTMALAGVTGRVAVSALQGGVGCCSIAPESRLHRLFMWCTMPA